MSPQPPLLLGLVLLLLFFANANAWKWCVAERIQDLQRTEEFAGRLDAISAAVEGVDGLRGLLDYGYQEMTFLLPTDAAFAELGLCAPSETSSVCSDITASNASYLRLILHYHIVKGVHLKQSMLGREMSTAKGGRGGDLFSVDENGVIQDAIGTSAHFLRFDVPVCGGRGLVHVVDKVLLGPSVFEPLPGIGPLVLGPLPAPTWRLFGGGSNSNSLRRRLLPDAHKETHTETDTDAPPPTPSMEEEEEEEEEEEQ